MDRPQNHRAAAMTDPYVHPIRAAFAEANAAITPLKVPPPRFADLRNGGNLPKRQGMIRYALALAILPVLFWNLPAIMRAIGEWW